MVLLVRDIFRLRAYPSLYILSLIDRLLTQICLSAIVIVSPMCDLAEKALEELRAATELFARGSEPCRHPRSLVSPCVTLVVVPD